MSSTRGVLAMIAGAAAGMAGTTAMFALRTFDQAYAPATIPKARKDPGEFLVQKMAKATDLESVFPSSFLRRRLEKIGAMTMQFAYGIAPGILYALVRGRTRRHASSLADGATIGAAVYVLGYFGWLPLTGLTRPVWKQTLPQVAGEAMRHVAYGVTTAAIFGALNSLMAIGPKAEALR